MLCTEGAQNPRFKQPSSSSAPPLASVERDALSTKGRWCIALECVPLAPLTPTLYTFAFIIDVHFLCASNNKPFVGAWRSLVAYLHGAQVVAGSNPAVPTIILR